MERNKQFEEAVEELVTAFKKVVEISTEEIAEHYEFGALLTLTRKPYEDEPQDEGDKYIGAAAGLSNCIAASVAGAAYNDKNVKLMIEDGMLRAQSKSDPFMAELLSAFGGGEGIAEKIIEGEGCHCPTCVEERKNVN